MKLYKGVLAFSVISDIKQQIIKMIIAEMNITKYPYSWYKEPIIVVL